MNHVLQKSGLHSSVRAPNDIKPAPSSLSRRAKLFLNFSVLNN